MTTARNPAAAAPPATYHHGIEVTGDVRTLYIAGQIGIDTDGRIAEGIEAQTRLVYANLAAVLASAAMSLRDVVRSTAYLVRREDRAVFDAVRAELSADAKNASTLLFVAGLALPELLVEIEAVAVRAVE